MTRVRLGAVGYLNARPLVFGVERSPRFDLRFDVPSKCAELLHEQRIEVGLIPSIEYLRHPAQSVSLNGSAPYRIVPDLAIASRGRVASVALFATRPMADVRSIAMDTSSRTSVALVRVLCARHYRIDPAIESRGPDLEAMLGQCDAALVIGDNALLADHEQVRLQADATRVEKIDLGEVWTSMTGLPFVWAFWAGRDGSLGADDIQELSRARDAGVTQSELIAERYFPGAPDRQRLGARYLQDNIKYSLGSDERAGLELFYRYAAEMGVVDRTEPLRFFSI